jgi:hypothetical protein
VLPYLKNLEIALVENILVDGAFDEALKNVKYVLHIASPLMQQVCGYHDPQLLLFTVPLPSWKGTQSPHSRPTLSTRFNRVLF